MLNTAIWTAGILGSAWLLTTAKLAWGRIKMQKRLCKANHSSNLQEGLSVVIPVRNESARLPELFRNLAQVQAPEGLPVEWIFVDDHSEDASWSSLHDLCSKYVLCGPIRIISAEGAGKKAAQASGVRAARHEWILFSDADCLWPSERLNYFQSLRTRPSCQVILGGVAYDAATSWFFKLDLEILIQSGAALTGLGQPILANGANLMCRRAVWLEHEAYLRALPVQSGDDVFLVQRVRLVSGSESVCFWDAAEWSVVTAGPRNVKEFWKQRLRWASKTPLFPSLLGRLLALWVWCVHVVGVGLACAAVFQPSFWAVPAFLFWLLKWGGDLLFFKSFPRSTTKLEISPLRWGLFALILPFYYASVAPASLLSMPWESWKGRPLFTPAS